MPSRNRAGRTSALVHAARSKTSRVTAASLVAASMLAAACLMSIGAQSASAAGCTETTSGACIRGGEYCPDSKEGTVGYDANGTAYECRNGHWESDAAAVTTYRSQAVGRFVDGSVGGMALQRFADLKDARRHAPANQKAERNPLNAELLGKIAVPIGNGLHLPGGGVFKAGAANQIAYANTSGYSYGASGAVENTGGAELTNKSNAYPGDATIVLNGKALGALKIPGLPSIPGLPTGSTNAAALGGVVAKVGAVQALAQTGTGGTNVRPQSSLSDLQLAIKSPALAALLKQLDGAFKANVLSALEKSNAQLAKALEALTGGTSCSLTSPASTTISLEGGAVVINAKTATITVDLKILLKRLLGVDIAHLSTSNFNLTKFLVRSLPTILSKGLTSIVTGITSSLTKQLATCEKAFDKALSGTPLGKLLPKGLLASTFTSLEKQLAAGVTTIADPLIKASSGGLATLADGLTGVANIGLNVQSGPTIQPHNQDYTYSTQLAKTPDQGTSVVKHQSLVRAIEIDLLDASNGAASGGLPSGGLPSVPGTNAANVRQLAGARAATAASSVVSIALGNAAAGPSVPVTTTPSSTPPSSSTPGTSVPTGVPAGAAGHDSGGSPLLPVTFVLVGLLVAGGGVLSLRLRARSTH